MLIMESENIEETSTKNATPAHDSGYSNTCSNSQSHTSSGSSVSRDSNRSVSSGYHGENPSTVGSCTETLPKPIAKRKDKEKGYKKKKKKSKNVTASIAHAETIKNSTSAGLFPVPVVDSLATLNPQEPCKPILEKTTEVAVVDLVDVTDPGIHNDNFTSSFEAGLVSKTSPIDESSSQFTEEYYAVMSMHDGLVLFATPSLHTSLGYPQDSWTGKLFIDFLDPRDKNIFTERIASEIALSRDLCPSGSNGRKESMFCRLRSFNVSRGANEIQGSSSGVHYVPFRINLIIQNFHGDKMNDFQNQVMLLIVSFQPCRSAYKEPEETIIPTVFTTRHNATCRLSYVDPDVVQYLGYLPQDMIDRSLFDFYYPEDLPLIKDIYETVMNLENATYRSKPYRYIVQNGGFVVLETEWSSFVNPWTKNLEFVVGQHRVLKGPADPNIFRSPGDQKSCSLTNISEEVLKEARIIQNEIVALLAKGVQRKPACAVTDSNLLSKKKELTYFVESILQEINSPAPIKDHMAMDERSFSGSRNPVLQEHDSVMLGEISPHHEYFDSKSSSETPPSYNQLNYHDNIERFFNSNIGVSVNNGAYGSDEENLHSSPNSSDDPSKNNTSRTELKCSSSINGSGNSGSAENLSSESNNQQSLDSLVDASNTISKNSTTNGRSKPPILTELLLNRHNEDMEKLMVQKHREQKKGDKRNKSLVNDQKVKADQSSARCDNANNKSGVRLKRSRSQSWEGDNNFKISKYDDSAKVPQNISQISATTNSKFTPTNMDISANMAKANPNVNLWPPITTTAPSTTTIAHQCFITSNAYSQAVTRFPTYPQMLPVYYLPTPQPRGNPPLPAVPQEHRGPPNLMSHPAPYCFVPVPYMTTAMPSVMYPPIIRAPAPATMMYRSFIVPEKIAPVAPLNVIPQPSCSPAAFVPSTTTATTNSATAVSAANSESKRPANRANNSKAEPATAIIMSESTKKHHKSKESRDNQTARKAFGMVRKEPPWIEDVKLTPELVYQYQIGQKSLNEVLKADLEFLRHLKQPNLVNDQLEQLFLDLDIEGMGPKLILEEAGTNSVSDSSSDGSQSPSRMGAW